MQILTINVGSSTLKLALLKSEKDSFINELFRKTFSFQKEPFQNILDSLKSEIFSFNESEEEKIIIHRIVSMPSKYKEPTILIDKKFLLDLSKNILNSPLHLERTLLCIHFFQQLFPSCLHLATSDSAFFSVLPKPAATYGLPSWFCEKHGLSKKGFHGLAHQSRWSIFSKHNPKLKSVISLQLGSGCSITAIHEGKPLDTSMGFSSLEGLIMSTRSGDVDPGLLLYILRKELCSLEELDYMLHHHSGLLGLSELSGDVAVLQNSSSLKSKQALDIYCYRIRKYLGSYLAILPDAEAILIGGGVGENSPFIREKIFWNLDSLGISIDLDKNNSAINGIYPIHSSLSQRQIWTIPADEERVLAEEALRFK